MSTNFKLKIKYKSYFKTKKKKKKKKKKKTHSNRKYEFLKGKMFKIQESDNYACVQNKNKSKKTQKYAEVVLIYRQKTLNMSFV